MSGRASATTHRSFVSYIDRTREFYAAQGYDRPYRWSRHADAPLASLTRPLAESRIALVTTASPWRDARGKPGSLRADKQVWSAPIDPPPTRLYTDDLSWDKEATHTEDVESFLPIAAVQALVRTGRVGALAPRFHGVPTDYSQRRTIEQDAPELLRRCHEDEVDIALLVPL